MDYLDSVVVLWNYGLVVVEFLWNCDSAVDHWDLVVSRGNFVSRQKCVLAVRLDSVE